MRGMFRIGLTIAVAVAGPALAQSTPFDGTYAGVSGDTRVTNSGGKCPPAQTPSPLIVANGTAHTQSGYFQGTATPDGKVILHAKEMYYQGRLDASGTLTVTGTTSYCEYTFTWKR